jgi:outer membrane immunogenic protein
MSQVRRMQSRMGHGVLIASLFAIPTISFSCAEARADISLEDLKARLEKLENKTIVLENENNQLRKKITSLTSQRAGRSAEKVEQYNNALANSAASTVPNFNFNSPPENIYAATRNIKGMDVIATGSQWEGAYAGINAGYGLGNIKTYTNSFTVDKTTGGVEEISNSNLASYIGGAIAGGQFGYNYLLSNHIMLGVESDIGWADIYNNVNPADSQAFSINTQQTGQPPCIGCIPPQPGNLQNEIGTSFSSNYNRVGLDWLGTARLRFGYEMGNFLPFITAGFAYGQLTSKFYDKQYGLEATQQPILPPLTQIGQEGSYNIGNASVLSTGWAAGAGMEYMVAKNWSIKAEYLYVSLGGITTPHISQSIEPSDTKTYTLENTGGFGIHQARIGLNYHPGWTISQPVLSLPN